MKLQARQVLFAAVSLALLSVVHAQSVATTNGPAEPATPPAAPAPAVQGTGAPAAPSTISDDRFQALRAEADQLKAAYESQDAKSMAEIDQLMRTKRCQINKIGGDLDRTTDAMKQWLDAETQYWKVWADAEQKRVDDQQKTLAIIEADQQRAGDLVASDKDAREELLRKKADLERYGKRTQDIVTQIDELVKDIQDSEARLADAQRTYDDLTVKVTNMKASISARLVDMRQNSARLDAYGIQLNAFYQKTRTAAQEVCNTKQPDLKRSPLPNRTH